MATPTAATLLTAAASTSNASTYTTASQSPTANRLLLFTVMASGPSVAKPTISGNGLTWTEVNSVQLTSSYWLVVYYALTGSSPSAGAVTITVSGGATGAGWHCAEVTGALLSASAIVQSATNTVVDASIAATLGSMASTSMTFAACDNNTNTAMTVERTTLGGAGHATPNHRLDVQWLNGQDTTPTFSFAAGTTASTIAVEIALATVAPTGPTVSVTPGTTTVTAARSVTPAGPTVTATAGSVAFGQFMDPVGPTISATPGTAGVAAGLTLVGPTVGVAAGAPTFELGLAVAGPTVGISPGAANIGPGFTVAGPTVLVAAADAAVDVGIAPTGATVNVTPRSLAIGDVSLVDVDGPTVSITAGTPQIDVGVAPAGPTVTVDAGATTVVAADVTATGPTVTVDAGDAMLAAAISAEGPTVSVDPGVPVVADAADLDEGGLPRWRRRQQQ